jgi:hypothetical protein
VPSKAALLRKVRKLWGLPPERKRQHDGKAAKRRRGSKPIGVPAPDQQKAMLAAWLRGRMLDD